MVVREVVVAVEGQVTWAKLTLLLVEVVAFQLFKALLMAIV
jgi:hypothetical protein